MSIFALFAISSAVSTTLNDPAEKTITFDFHDVSLRNALDTLIVRDHVAILYLDSDVEGTRISARCESCSEEEALSSILRSTLLSWRWTGAQFVISRQKRSDEGAENDVSGRVVDSLSNEYISGASVFLVADTSGSGTSSGVRGCVTNRYGYFSFPDVPPGAYTVAVRALGYKTTKERVKATADGTFRPLRVRCVQGVIEMQEVLIEAARSLPVVMTPGLIRVDPVALALLPALGGESDVLRGLQLLPGVKSISEISSGLYIRGATSDQNLYMLDGATIYNPTHLGGFISTFNPDALRDVSISKGTFSPEYGGRIGGVVDMMMREGTQDHITGSAGISLLDARLTLEGPLAEGTTFMIAGRRAYLDFFLPYLFVGSDQSPRYYFYDVEGKVNSRLSESDHLFASGYVGRDVFTLQPNRAAIFFQDQSQTDIWWGNTAANLRWTHILSPSLFATVSAVYSTYSFNADETSAELPFTEVAWGSNSGIRDIVFKMQLEYFAGKSSTITVGAEVVNHKIQSNVASNTVLGLTPLFQLPSVSPFYNSAWATDSWEANESLVLNIGARLSRFSSSKGKFVRFEPRLSGVLKLEEDVSLHASLSESNQFLHSLADRGLVAYFPTNVMYPATDRIQPSSSFHVSAGADARLFDGLYTFTSDVYWRTMENIHEFKDNATFTPGFDLEDQIISGKGKSYGLELLLRRQEGSFTGWIGYSLT